MKLERSNVLITGASRGLGAALAWELGKRGARLVLVARECARLEALCDALTREGIVAYAVAGDIGDKFFIHALAGRAQALLGSIDIVVHNASTLGKVPLALLADTECEDFGRALDVNLLGPFRLTKALLPGMILRGAGTIVHVSSDAAVQAYPTWGAYGVSKAALDHLSKSFDAELTGSGITVFSVDPGEMDTDMHRDAVPDADPASLARPHDVAQKLAALLTQRGLHGRRIVLSAEALS